MIERKTWEEFRAAGFLWFANRILHLFGWAIVVEVEKDGTVSDVYPARVQFRGFDSESEGQGFIQVTQYLHKHSAELLKEAEE